MNGFIQVKEQRSQGMPGRAITVHTLLCTNAAYLQHAAVCLVSLLANNPGFFFDIVIVSQPGENLDEARLQRTMAQFSNQSLTFRTFKIPAGLLLPLNPRAHYTLDTYSRLWIGEFFPPHVSRVLYLDADLVVVGSVAPLWSTDLDGALMGAVDIPGSDRGVTRLAMRLEDGYFNAGVLLVDVAQWRDTRAEQAVIDYIRANPERVLYDQDALNACFRDRTKRLDYKWNVIWPFYREPTPLPLEQAELAAVRREALIIHFNGASKPWSYFCDHPRRADYDRYLRMTEWRDFVPSDRTPLNRLRKFLSALLPALIKTGLKATLARANARRLARAI
ncbi:MAG TPA: glycosyltransferase family 8 protein [Acetobacteraceae bacterium]|jgi:lipopolysaccharide biosynthesis glycosyltransferase|nr:glycosyltransferase family 8 protein [Acetobacteraceae bacterium]